MAQVVTACVAIKHLLTLLAPCNPTIAIKIQKGLRKRKKVFLLREYKAIPKIAAHI
jgi:hypothetical protein